MPNTPSSPDVHSSRNRLHSLRARIREFTGSIGRTLVLMGGITSQPPVSLASSNNSANNIATYKSYLLYSPNCKLRSNNYTSNSLLLTRVLKGNYSCIIIGLDNGASSVETNCSLDELTNGEDGILDHAIKDKDSKITLNVYTLKQSLIMDNSEYNADNLMIKVTTLDTNTDQHFIVYNKGKKEIDIKKVIPKEVNKELFQKKNKANTVDAMAYIFSKIIRMKKSHKPTYTNLTTQVQECVTGESSIKHAGR